MPLYPGVLGLIIFALACCTAARSAENPPRLGGQLIDGSVTKARGCGSHFFVVYGDSYLVAQWLGGEIVKDGDVLQVRDADASFEREGRVTVTNLATGNLVDLVIEKALMNRSTYARTVAALCR